MRREIEKKRNNESGFTLLEMMIVVAIIAVLVVISIPTFTGILEKGREATDLANVRSAYAEVMIAAITQDTTSSYYVSSTNTYEKSVNLTQKNSGWVISSDEMVIGGISSSDTVHWKGTPTRNGTCTVIYNNENGEVILKWSGYIISINKQWSDSQEVDGHRKLKLEDNSLSPGWPANAITEFVSAKVNQTLVVKEITQKEFPNLYKHLESGATYEIGVYMANEQGMEMADTGGIKIEKGEKTEIKLTPSSYELNDVEMSKGVTDMKLAIAFFKVKNPRTGFIELTTEEAEELSNIFYITD